MKTILWQPALVYLRDGQLVTEALQECYETQTKAMAAALAALKLDARAVGASIMREVVQ